MNLNAPRLFALAILLACALPARCGAAGLEDGFRHPPAAARPWVYWFFMDGNWSRNGITADLEAMQKAGIGGVIMMEVNVGVPRGPVDFMSQTWRELFRHTVREAERLGLEIALNAGPGWTGSGGPWVAPDQSMQHLVAVETNVSGPARLEVILPRPLPRPPFFGEGALPPALERARKEFFRDVFVLAFPKPSGVARIRDIDEKALYVRAPYSSQKGVKPFLPAPADFPAVPSQACIHTNEIVDLTANLLPDDRLVWDVPAGDWIIVRLARTATGQNTRPAPEPGLGLECDKFDKAALDMHFNAFIGKLLETVGPRRTTDGGWTMLHIDSWEMSSQNWTPQFREEFKRRRGYDLLLFLPVLHGHVVENAEISERFLWDLRQTAQELVVENHALHLKELGHKHGLGLSIEPYDMNPCADLTLGGTADVPMCEFWSKGHGFKTEFTCLEAASIAHTVGRPIVAAESFTSDASERWLLYPGALKAQADWALCAGVNRIVFHRYQHQPSVDRRPGMTMGPYGVHWERTQTWWNLVPAFHQYLARCQFVLRQGLAVADVCYLVAEGAPHVFRPPASATRGDPPDRLGYTFDGCAPETVLTRMSVDEGRLVLPNGMSYAVLVLPDRDTMTPALLRKVKELVEAGATVIGPRPLKSPSLAGYPRCDEEVKKVAAEAWGDGTELSRSAGRVIPQNNPRPPGGTEQYGDFSFVGGTLESMGIPMDFESDASIRYTHRRDAETDIYFVASGNERAINASCTFRVLGRLPELWDPVTGEVRDLPAFTVKNGRTVVPIHFEAAQSYFVVFRRKSVGLAVGTQRNIAATTAVLELSGSWELSFDPRLGGPEKVTFSSLEDWTSRAEEGIRFYSGTAVYRKMFDIPGNARTQAGKAGKLFLDLGIVRNLAQVRLNGRDLGVVWCAPWRVDMTELVRETSNELEITVANLWPNRLIGDQSLPPEKRITSTTWNPFKVGDRLSESGLLGPVKVLVSQGY